MKLKHLLLAVVLILTTQVYAQTGRQVSGVVKDSVGVGLPMATVKLLSVKDSAIVIANAEGRFIFPSVTVNQFSLLVSSLGYQAVKRRYTLIPGSAIAELDPVILKMIPFR
jgi:hypothetical protein